MLGPHPGILTHWLGLELPGIGIFPSSPRGSRVQPGWRLHVAHMPPSTLSSLPLGPLSCPTPPSTTPSRAASFSNPSSLSFLVSRITDADQVLRKADLEE